MAVSKAGHEVIENDGFEVDVEASADQVLAEQVSDLLAKVIFNIGIQRE